MKQGVMMQVDKKDDQVELSGGHVNIHVTMHIVDGEKIVVRVCLTHTQKTTQKSKKGTKWVQPKQSDILLLYKHPFDDNDQNKLNKWLESHQLLKYQKEIHEGINRAITKK